MQTKFSATIKVFSIIRSDNVMPPFFLEGPRLNTNEYISILREVAKP